MRHLASLLALAALCTPQAMAQTLMEPVLTNSGLALTGVQGGRLDSLLANGRFINPQLIQVDPSTLSGQAVAPGLGLPVFLTDRLSVRASDDLSWFGTSVGELGSAVVVARHGLLFGNIHHGGETYHIRPLGGDAHVLLQVAATQGAGCATSRLGQPGTHTSPPGSPSSTTPISHGPGVAQATTEEIVLIDTLIAYTPAAAEAAVDIEGVAQLAIDSTNQSYANSCARTRLVLSTTYLTDYVETDIATDLDRLQRPADGEMDEVVQVRNYVSADIVILLGEGYDWCGYAWVNATAPLAFGVVLTECVANLTFAHEVGHIQGADHDIANSSSNSYNHGHIHPGGIFRTVMAYDTVEGGVPKIPFYSNPEISVYGQTIGTADVEDNARVINETAEIVASFRVPLPPGCQASQAADTSLGRQLPIDDLLRLRNGMFQDSQLGRELVDVHRRYSGRAALLVMTQPRLAVLLGSVMDQGEPAAKALLNHDESVIFEAELAASIVRYVGALSSVADQELALVLRQALATIELDSWIGQPVVEVWDSIKHRRLSDSLARQSPPQERP